MPEYIERAQAENVIKTFGGKRYMILLEAIREEHSANVIAIPAAGIGDLSDGYHTFNDLYYQRMFLFAALVKQNKGKAWKSYRHEDGEPCFGGGWFIVGIDTPEGSYTYHYENKDFDLFDCEELPVAKHWDGHTEVDVTRLLYLPAAIEELSKKTALAPIDNYAGLKRKYIVLKADTGEDVPDCFVLRPAKDKAAVEALRAYAKATDNDLLSADIYRWVGPLPELPREET